LKKLLVVLLAAVMVLSLAAVAMAADVSTWMGGDLFFKYNSVAKGWVNDDNTFTVGNITAKVSKDNTWAKTFLNIDTWQGTPINGGLHYAFGVDKLGGMVSLSFSTKDQDICNIGQVPMMDLFDDFKGDPYFDTYSFGNSAAMVIDSDTFTVKAEAVIIGAAVENAYAIDAIYKFDGGKAYVAWQGNRCHYDGGSWGGEAGSRLIDAGTEFKLGDLGIKADLWMNTVAGTATSNVFQGNVASGPWDATLVYVMPNGGNGVFGVGGNYKVGENLTVGAKYMAYNPNAQYELLATYQYGVLGLRVGYINPGTGSSDDNYFVLGVHAGIW